MKSVYACLVALILLNSCGSESSEVNKRAEGSNSGTSTTQTTNNATPPTTTTPTPSTGVTYYPDPDPAPPTVNLPGQAFSACGTAYIAMNSDDIFFASGGSEYVANHYGQGTQAFLHQIVFTSNLSRSAYDICFDGYVNGNDVFVETITSSSATGNPTITTSGYSNRLCGYAAFQQSYNATYLTLQVDQTNYIVETTASTSAFPNVGRASVTASNGVETCMYSNSNTYQDLSRGHKPFFPVDFIDLGDL